MKYQRNDTPGTGNMKRRHDITDRELDQALDQWSRELQRHEPPPGLAQRILNNLPADSAASAEPAPHWLDWLRARLWRPALVAAFPVVIGFVLGVGLPAPVDRELAEEITLLAFSDVFEELDDAQQ